MTRRRVSLARIAGEGGQALLDTSVQMEPRFQEQAPHGPG